MQIKIFDKKYVSQIVALWNESVVPFSIYKEWNDAYFIERFVNNPFFDYKGFKLVFENNTLIGFGHAIVNNNDVAPGYITCIAVARNRQRQGIGTYILGLLEDYLRSKDKKLIRLYFMSPINLEWYVPGTKCDHPGAPAIPFNSAYYFFLMNNGYIVNGHQDSFYLDITNYELPEKVIKKDAENKLNGYTIEIYDPKKHQGFAELFEALRNPGWHDAVKYNLAKAKPDPMLVVQKDGVILGWTGPMYPQPSGRGYFAGIGVHPNTQGLGLGKSLFCHLVYESKKYGAKFMTFFTGADNLARNIYLYAGFRIIQSFCVLRKELS